MKSSLALNEQIYVWMKSKESEKEATVNILSMQMVFCQNKYKY